MSFEMSKSCLTYTYPTSTASLTTLGSMVAFTVATGSNPIILADNGITSLSDLIQNTVYKSNWCTTQYPITAPTLTTTTYYYTIGTAPETITIPDFSIAPTTCTDLIWAYSGYQMSGTAENPLNAAFITLSGQTFTVSTTDEALGGNSYTIEFKATLPNDQYSTVIFTLILRFCFSSVISTTAIASTSYDIHTPIIMILGNTLWTQTITDCPTITFQLLDRITLVTADSIFSINGTNIQIVTNDPNKRTTYNLRLVGTVGAYVSAQVDFDVTVFDSCSSTVITPSTVAD